MRLRKISRDSTLPLCWKQDTISYSSGLLEWYFSTSHFFDKQSEQVMMGMEFTGKAPFHTVYLHGIIRDSSGEKMSKTKGLLPSPSPFHFARKRCGSHPCHRGVWL